MNEQLSASTKQPRLVTPVEKPGLAELVAPVEPPYDLIRTLSCGQAFRWRVEGRVATGVFAGRQVRLEQFADGIAVRGLDAGELAALRRYLSLDAPLGQVEDRLRGDPVLRRILPRTTGIALLRQDPWECLVSFVVSAFNNIPKIELSLDRLARRFGRRAGEGLWRFPEAQHLAQARMRELRGCALGYRAPYVRTVARLVASGGINLEMLGSLTYAEARRILLTLPGVGEKVADCVLLFAYGMGEAFPVDVWIKRAVEAWYFGGRTASERRIRAFAQGRFGPLAGYAQQHLYYYVRERGTAKDSR